MSNGRIIPFRPKTTRWCARGCVHAPTLPVVSPSDESQPTDQELKQRVGYVIQRARLARSMTAPVLADLLHTTPKTINRWEKGEAAPSLIDLGPLCAALGIDPQAFIDLPADPVSRYLLLAGAAIEAAEEEIAEEEARAPASDARLEDGPRKQSA